MSQHALKPGDRVITTNATDSGCKISVVFEDGSQVNVGLAPGQSVELVTGAMNATINIEDGDPAGLKVVDQSDSEKK